MTALLIASAFLLQQAPAPVAALNPDTAFVGDHVNVAVRVDAPRDSRLLIPDTLAISGNFENAARARIRTDTLEDGSLRFTAYYTIVGWRPGETAVLPPIEAVLRTPSGDQSLTIQPPALTIASVLPADTAGIEPKPLKDVLGPTRVWWLAALAVLAALIVAGLLLWWWMRRRRQRRALAPAPVAIAPRERFLRELDEISQTALRSGDLRAFYIGTSAALRRYLASLDPAWGEELTTTELSPRMRAPNLMPVLDVLDRADLVKFARREVHQDEAQRDLRDLRRWADSYNQPAQPQLVEAA